MWPKLVLHALLCRILLEIEMLLNGARFQKKYVHFDLRVVKFDLTFYFRVIIGIKEVLESSEDSCPNM